MTPAEQAARIIDSCHCLQPAEPSPCDGWLQHRKCDSLAHAIAQAIEQARREGMETAAKYHDDQAGWYEMEWEGGQRNPRWAQWHRLAAAAIRARAQDSKG